MPTGLRRPARRFDGSNLDVSGGEGRAQRPAVPCHFSDRFTWRSGMRWGFLTLVLVSTALPPVNGDDWPQWFGPQRDGVWREDGILDKFPLDGPKQVWKAPLGAGYSGPAVANGFVFVMDRKGPLPDPKVPAKGISGDGKERVVCLKEKTGEQVWVHEYDCTYRRI